MSLQREALASENQEIRFIQKYEVLTPRPKLGVHHLLRPHTLDENSDKPQSLQALITR